MSTDPAPGSPGVLLLRADGDADRGLGHLVRGLALAHAWVATGGLVTLVTAGGTEGVDGELGRLDAAVVRIDGPPGSEVDAGATRAAATERHATWMVVDGEQFDAGYLRSVRAPATRLLLVDDFGHRGATDADLVLNQNLGATADRYPDVHPTHLLLGTRHLLLRPPFAADADGPRPPVPNARRLLVFLGGSDPDGTTPRVIEALHGLGADWRVDVVVGAHAGTPVRTDGDPRFRVHAGVDDMAGLMGASDLAIVAAGGAMWELLAMQVATLSFARNPLQAEVVAELGDRGAVVALGSPADLDPARLVTEVEALAADAPRREAMAGAGRSIVDGRGAHRVVAAMSACADG